MPITFFFFIKVDTIFVFIINPITGETNATIEDYFAAFLLKHKLSGRLNIDVMSVPRFTDWVNLLLHKHSCSFMAPIDQF